MTEFINFLSIIFFSGEQSDELKLPKWVKVTKQRFDVTKSKIQNAKNNSLQARPNRSKLVTLNESNKLLQDIEYDKISYEEAWKKRTYILGDIKKFNSLTSFTQNQLKVVNALFMVDEVFTGKFKVYELNNEGKYELFDEKSDIDRKESDEQLDTTNKPEIGSGESEAERRNQRGQGLKILTLDQILSRLPITLAQLKAGNNSQKLINEIRQLLYSLYHSKKLTKTIYNHLIYAI